jgi:hypothetical protein
VVPPPLPEISFFEDIAATSTRPRCLRQTGICRQERDQILIGIKINRAESARGSAKVNGNINVLNREQRSIRSVFVASNGRST